MEPNALVECAYELMGSLKEELQSEGLLRLRSSSCTTETARSSRSHRACSHPRRERRLSQGHSGTGPGKPERMAPSWGWTAIASSPTLQRCERRIHGWYRPPPAPASMR